MNIGLLFVFIGTFLLAIMFMATAMWLVYLLTEGIKIDKRIKRFISLLFAGVLITMFGIITVVITSIVTIISLVLTFGGILLTCFGVWKLFMVV